MNVNILEQEILVTVYEDETITATLINNNELGQSAITFEDEGLPLGTAGTVTEVDFVGAGVTAVRTLDKVTVTIPGGGGGGSGDVVGPAVAVDSNLAAFDTTTGKLIKDSGLAKDATGGVAGLTLFNINFKNALNTFTSFFTNANTAARTYTFQDRDGTIADTYVNRIKGSTNNRYVSNHLFGAPGTGALSANLLRAHPFELTFPCTIDLMLVEITTGTTGNMRIGIYADDGTGYPGALLVDSGQFVISAPAVLSATISTALLPGIYWLAYITNTANTVRTTPVAQALGFLGFPSTLGPTSPLGTWTVSLAYQALPSTFTAGATAVGVNYPLIALRIS